MSLSVAASRPKVKHSGESILFGFDFTALLAVGETITGAVTVTDGAGVLTISSVAANAATFINDEGGTVAINCGIQARISGASGVDGTDYTLTATGVTSAGNTRKLVCTLQVRNS